MYEKFPGRDLDATLRQPAGSGGGPAGSGGGGSHSSTVAPDSDGACDADVDAVLAVAVVRADAADRSLISSGCGGGFPGVRDAGRVGNHEIFSRVCRLTCHGIAEH